LSNPWYESDKIIFICYPCGAGGYALRYLLGLSPKTDVQIYVRDEHPTRPDGAAHHILSINDLRVNLSDNHPLRLREMHKSLFGLDANEKVFWNKIPNTELVSHIQNILYGCYSDYDNKLMQDSIQDKHIILADHLPICMIKALFPNAKVLKLFRNPLHCLRHFFIKNHMQSISYDNHQKLILLQQGFDIVEKSITTLDAILLANNEPYDYINYKNKIRNSFNWINMQTKNIGDDAYMVNGDKLFEPELWLDEYVKLLTYCGLNLNLPEAENFIIDYHSKQFNRLTYTPNPNWEWVKASRQRN